MSRILVVENDEALARFLGKHLEAEGYIVNVNLNVIEETRTLERDDCDLMIMGLAPSVPEELEVLTMVKAKRPARPVLVLLGESTVATRVRTFDLGADGCLGKPVSPTELSARVRQLLRRANSADAYTLRLGELEIHRLERTAKQAGQNIDLTAKEFALLEYLAMSAGRPVTRAMIARDVWKFAPGTFTNVVEVYINYLRKKLSSTGSGHVAIRTIRGVGYQIVEAPAAKVRSESPPVRQDESHFTAEAP